MGYRAGMLAWIVLVFGLFSPVFAGRTVYRRTINGQTVLTDRPCDSPPAAVVSPDGSKSITATPTVVGDWRGQGQFQGTENGRLIADAHTVVPLVLTFTADGKVTGSSPDNGCEVLGLWYVGGTPRLFTLDVTLSKCRYSGFTRQYSGSFVATFPTNSGELALQAYAMPILGQATRRYDVGATLRR